MKIIFYCQYVWGMGHLVRSLEFARALADHDVALIAGGQEVAVDLPAHVRLVRLPVLYMDEKFTRLIAGNPDLSVEQIRQKRKQLLYSLFEDFRPDVFIVELYPFGRSRFGFELEPLLSDVRAGRFGNVKTICSLRDILVEKKHRAAYEEKVLQKLKQYFDALLVHSDPDLLHLGETFSRAGDIDLPVIYTGFIAQRADPDVGKNLRRQQNIPAEKKLVVASAGGGRSGYPLLKPVIDACEALRNRLPIQLEVFTGPFMDNELYEELVARNSPGLRVRRYTDRFLDFLYAADLSVSLAGYNTCMNLLVTKVPALVYPYSKQQEQPMRAAKLKHLLTMRILEDADVQPDRLSGHITQMLTRPKHAKHPPVNLNGAANAARFLEQFV